MIVMSAFYNYTIYMWAQVEMKLPAAGWGVLNFTSAGLRDWSLTDSMAACAQLTHSQVCLLLDTIEKRIFEAQVQAMYHLLPSMCS